MEYPSRPHGLEATDRTGNNYAIYSGLIYMYIYSDNDLDITLGCSL